VTDFSDDPLTLDANAVGGMLHEVFGMEMTARVSECAHCGNHAQVGTLRVYDMDGPGVVLRCSVCSGVMLLLVRRPDGSFFVEASGAVDLDV
jgi:hypothetical protein